MFGKCNELIKYHQHSTFKNHIFRTKFPSRMFSDFFKRFRSYSISPKIRQRVLESITNLNKIVHEKQVCKEYFFQPTNRYVCKFRTKCSNHNDNPVRKIVINKYKTLKNKKMWFFFILPNFQFVDCFWEGLLQFLPAKMMV